MKSVEIDRSKRLKEEPHQGHNRWHPDVQPVIEVDPGEEVVLETRDATDGQVTAEPIGGRPREHGNGDEGGPPLDGSRST